MILASDGSTNDGDSKPQPEAYLYRNWVIVLLLSSVMGTAYSITLPSMHQFVTNPSAEHHNNATQVNDHTMI